VLSASDRSKNLCSSPQRMTTSSASRLRCTIVIAHAYRNVAAKSRSDEASMLLSTTREKPRSRASWSTSIAYAIPATAPEPDGRSRGASQAREVAAQRRGVREEEVRHEHGLCRAEVREGRHQRIAGRRRLRGQRLDDARDRALKDRDAPAQIQAQVERHLF